LRLDQLFIRIDPEPPSTRSVAERLVPSGGEIVAPRKVEDLGSGLLGNIDRAIGRARVHQDDFVDHAGKRLQATAQMQFLVPGDDARRNGDGSGPHRPA